MNQIPNIEEWKKLAKEILAPNVTYIDPKFKEVASWAEELLNAFWVEQQKDLDAFIDTLHQQLQKAVQEENLKHCCCVIEDSKVIERCKLHGDELQKAREELAGEVRLLVAKYYKTDEFDEVGFLNELQTELDQDNK